jgi:hypothetical protein
MSKKKKKEKKERRGKGLNKYVQFSKVKDK